MASLIEWKVPQAVQPRAEDYSYDLERALSSVVGLHSIVPLLRIDCNWAAPTDAVLKQEFAIPVVRVFVLVPSKVLRIK